MERETVIANVRSHLDFTEAAQTWLGVEAATTWVADGDLFLQEFGGQWLEIFAETLQHEVHEYFHSVGLRGDLQPQVRIGDSYRGSFIIDAYIVIATGIPAAYTLLKGVSELPQIADGLENLKTRVAKEYEAKSSRFAVERIADALRHARQGPNRLAAPTAPSRIPAPPQPLLASSLVIDARPLRNLKPEEPVSHRVHLAVAATHDVLTVENLSEEALQQLRIGLFVGNSPRAQWAFAEAFTGSVTRLGARQMLSKDLADFRNASGKRFQMGSNRDQYLDCWVQDEHGIYLFNFVLHP